MTIPTDSWVRIGAATTPVFSRDGTRLFHLRGAGLPQVWVMDRDGGNASPVSAHDEKVAILRRAPTDDRLIWGIDAGGDERQQFWLRSPDGTVRALTENPAAIHEFGGWSPDGSQIAFAANDRDERIFDVQIMDVATRAVRRLIVSPGVVSIPGFSPDGTTLAVVYDHSSSDQRLMLVDTITAAVTTLPRPSPVRYASLRWSGNMLMGLTDEGSDFMRLCRIDPATGAPELVAAADSRDIEAWSMSPDGAVLATVENDRGYGVLRVGPAAGPRHVVTGLPSGVVADLAWAADSSTLAFCAQGPANPPALYLWQGGQAAPVALPDPLDETGITRADLVAPVLVEWPSFDAMRIPGWYARPQTPMPAGGYPSVVWVHGGPASQTRANFRADIQMLLSQGFVVLMPNMRGSTGYGRTYMEADEVEKRPDMLQDLAHAHAWLAARPEIDPARIGIMGQSYGGWAVLAAVTLQPDLWVAAVNYYGIADFVTLLDRTGPWRADHRAREYGFPGTDDALFQQISPIHHVAHVRAPLLVLHGDRDPRVPMHESDQFVAAMEQHQKPVRYERFTYAGHGFIRPDHRVRVYAAVAEHFNTHLTGAT